MTTEEKTRAIDPINSENKEATASTSRPTFATLVKDKLLVHRLFAQNIIEPTEVQAQSIPLALQNIDLIVQAQTGSGKTLAFMLPIIAKIRAAGRTRNTLALVVTPTRELALQVKSVVATIAPDVKPACLIGGASAQDQEKQILEDARIIVGTPGRLLDFIRQGLVKLNTCATFVLDEADEMLSMGFVDEVRTILTKLPIERQGLFFSATVTPRVASLANSFLRNPQTILIETHKDNAPKIEHLYCNVEGGVTSKVDALGRLLALNPDQSAIVFCNTKSDTELVEVCLKRRGFHARRINSDLTQRERDAVLTALRTGELRYLVATDVAARGIDIKELEMVINYALPKEPEVYTHRTGRTGRAGASGKAISFIAPQDFGAFYQLKKQSSIELKELILPVEEPVTP